MLRILSLRAGCVDIKAYMIPEASRTRAQKEYISLIYFYVCIWSVIERSCFYTGSF